MTNHSWTRSRNDRIVGGVAAGVAAGLHLPVGVVRAALVVLAVGFAGIPPMAGALLVLYVAAIFLLPEAALEPDRRPAAPLIPGLVRPRQGRMVAGVALGLARAGRLDPTLVRVVLVVLALAGAGLIGYVVLWLVMPDAGAAA